VRLFANKRKRERLVTPSTELVIEGFPRSGNTFAVAAFMLSQPQPVRIAHHHHVPAQIISAVRQGIPTLVVVRKPDDAVLSLVIREPFLSIRAALLDYHLFHDKILPYADGYVAATFEQVTSDFGSVILGMNRKLGTSFAPFAHTKENVSKCFQLLDKLDMQDTGRSEVTESTVARPSEERDKLKHELKKRFGSSANAKALEKAGETYRGFLEITSGHLGS
jgi:hypothetical protein